MPRRGQLQRALERLRHLACVFDCARRERRNRRAAIFIPVDNGYGGVRIYELHDSDAAGAAIWVETLRAVVHQVA